MPDIRPVESEDTGVSLWVVVTVVAVGIAFLMVPAWYLIDDLMSADGESADDPAGAFTTTSSAAPSPPTTRLATMPAEVSFEVVTMFSGEGVFTASGEAVARNLICASGTTHDVFFQEGPGESFNARITKEFTCAGSSGGFHIDLVVRTVQEQIVFDWMVSPNDKSGLIGGGVGFVSGEFSGGVVDSYEGSVQG